MKLRCLHCSKYLLPLAVLLLAVPACKKSDPRLPPVANVDYSVQFQRAQEAYLNADYRNALGPLNLILSSNAIDDSAKAEPAYWAGFCHLKLGDYASAEQRFLQATEELSATYLMGQALVGLADSQRMVGKRSEADANYRRALEQYSTFIDSSKVKPRIGGTPVIPRPGPVEITPEVSPSSPGASGSFTLQAGAFQERAAAMLLVNRLKATGYPPFIQQLNRQGKLLYCVRVGVYRDKAGAEAAQKQLKARGFDSFVVQ